MISEIKELASWITSRLGLHSRPMEIRVVMFDEVSVLGGSSHIVSDCIMTLGLPLYRYNIYIYILYICIYILYIYVYIYIYMCVCMCACVCV